MNEIIKKHLEEHQSVLSTLESLAPQIEKVANLMIKALENGKTIFWCGNGGSASDAQHLAGELVLGQARRSSCFGQLSPCFDQPRGVALIVHKTRLDHQRVGRPNLVLNLGPFLRAVSTW